ncbi:histone H1C-like [Hyperolius riggenbachi]|uniref:histone H1C-like n=1 Tax=Hyperolius riggenbachi TaxID=752182 RepID=UPI0035A2E6B8
MAETAPAAAPPAAEPAAKKKQTKKAAAGGGAKKASKKPSGPAVSELILKAVSASKERSGVSLAALKKALAAGGYDVEKNNSRLKLAIKGLLTKGSLVHVKGTGASGSFKVSKKEAAGKEHKKPAAAKKKPAAAAKPKKPATARKPKAAKSPKKPKPFFF